VIQSVNIDIGVIKSFVPKLGIPDLLTPLRSQILAIAEQHGAYNVRVFGSVARGEARADSDVDFLVDFLPQRNLLDRIALIQDLEELLGRKIDVAKLANLSDDMKESVNQQAVVL
jgi:uncharacterized protein